MKMLVLGLVGVLAACSHLPPPQTARCVLPSYRLLVNQNGLGAGDHAFAGQEPDELTKKMSAELGAVRPLRQSNDDLLILSGGSQHGAFGAGFFEGLGETPSGVPTYRFVTG